MRTTPRPLKPDGIRALAYRVGCTKCAAQIGVSCVSLFGHVRTHPHAVRVRRAKAKATPLGALTPSVQVVETPAEPRVALPTGTDVEAQVHAVLRMLAGEPTDEVSMVKARHLLHTAGITATLAWAGLQFRVTLPDGREFLSPAVLPKTLREFIGLDAPATTP